MNYINPQKLANDYMKVRALSKDGRVALVASRHSGAHYVMRKLQGNDLFVYHTISNLCVPGIPKPLFYSETEGGYVIIEEYIEGYTLSYYIQKFGPLHKDVVFNYIVQLCDILTPLHKNMPAIIHRDIKPSNVLLSNTGEIYLLDFDAATYYTPLKDGDTVLLGTHGYAAPEQYGFNASDPRTDIYALGKLAMTLMNGGPCESTTYTGAYNLIFRRCTNMDPNNRFANASELKRALLKNKNNPGGFKMPGYRSGNKAIAVCASIAYAFIPFFGILNLLDKDYKNFFFGITFFIASIIVSMAVFNYRDYLSKLPGANSSSPGVRTISRLFYVAALVVIIVLAFGFAADSLGLLNR